MGGMWWARRAQHLVTRQEQGADAPLPTLQGKEDNMTSGQKERVGIVGAGRMGHAMLKHLVKHGYEVTVCDVNAEAVAKAKAAGAKTADSPAALAKAATF